MYEVYALSLDGKTFRYVGATKYSAVGRLRRHRHDARNGADRPLSRWMRENGVDNVQTRVLVRAETFDDLKLAERWWIAALREDGYDLLNTSDGGDGATEGWTHSDEARAKIRAASTGKTHTKEARAKISAANKGQSRERNLSEEAKARMLAAHVGRKCSEETKAKMRLAAQRREARRREQQEQAG